MSNFQVVTAMANKGDAPPNRSGRRLKSRISNTCKPCSAFAGLCESSAALDMLVMLVRCVDVVLPISTLFVLLWVVGGGE
jgi:hypothetical protein